MNDERRKTGIYCQQNKEGTEWGERERENKRRIRFWVMLLDNQGATGESETDR